MKLIPIKGECEPDVKPQEKKQTKQHLQVLVRSLHPCLLVIIQMDLTVNT